MPDIAQTYGHVMKIELKGARKVRVRLTMVRVALSVIISSPLSISVGFGFKSHRAESQHGHFNPCVLVTSLTVSRRQIINDHRLRFDLD